MRLLMIIGMLAALPWGAALAAPTWQTISSEPGKRIEIDRTNLKREGSVVQALGRVVLDKELIDGRSGAPYRVIEATTRYDCATRSANTIKRTFKKNENDIVREEEPKGIELPVRTGTLDDKVLREVCRPPKDTQVELAKKANEAAGELKAANDALLKNWPRPKSRKASRWPKPDMAPQRPRRRRIPNTLPFLPFDPTSRPSPKQPKNPKRRRHRQPPAKSRQRNHRPSLCIALAMHRFAKREKRRNQKATCWNWPRPSQPYSMPIFTGITKVPAA
jgi:carbonic anhydrase